jgi:predicted outer membrane repeat protein
MRPTPRPRPWFLVCLLSTPFGSLSAATLIVDDSGGQDYTRIQDAVDAATSGDLIQVRAGVYSETVSIDGKSLTIQGASSASVQVRGDSSGATLAVDGGGTCTISGLSLSGGERGLTVRQSSASFSDILVDANSTAGNGGGVGIFEGADVVISDCVISDNQASSPYHGGGVYVDASELLLERCELSGNEAEQGGAIYVEAGEVELVDCTLEDNTAHSHGGAVRLRDGASLTASGTVLQRNVSSGRGGAVSIEDSDSSWASCSMLDNTAATGGGAMHLSGALSSGSVVDATIDGNTASGAGGGIWAWDHDLTLSGIVSDNISPDTEAGGGVYVSALDLVLSGVTISGHLAANGGGVYASSGSTVRVSSSSLEDNEAVESGGGLYATGDVTLSASSFSNNTAGDQGGGVYVNGGDLTVSSTAFSGNSAAGAGGGAMVRAGSVELSAGTTVSGNRAAQGGGICALGGGSSEARFYASYGSFTDNEASSSGGGLYADAMSTTTLAGTGFSGNSAGGWGGGLYLLDVTAVWLNGISVSDNEALQGGGMYLASLAGTVKSSVVSANSAIGEGGGVVLSAPDSWLNFTNNRVLENEANAAGGVYVSADAGGFVTLVNNDVVANGGGGIGLASSPATAVYNTMVVGNAGPGVSADDANHSGNISYNLLHDNDPAWGGELGSLTGSDGNIEADPGYRSWADDGDATTENLLLRSDSAARDAGDPALLDLDGSRSDMGSYGGPHATDGDDDGDGWARSDGDCDDAEPAANPGQSEQIYDGVDNDCDPSTLDDDLDGDGFGHERDCDDQDASINPDAEDTPGDGVDQNCDGVDGEAPEDTGDTGFDPDDTGPFEDLDGDGYSPPEDCNEQEPLANPGMDEICDDGFDNDCDGAVDHSDADCLEERDTSCELGCAAGGRATVVLPWLLALTGMLVSRRRRV